MAEETRAGFVAVLGAPNVGKSTLVNRLVGAKVTIVSPKVQTTRSRIRGIRVVDSVQIVFVDTPGIFNAKRRLERAMVHAAWSGAADADAILLLVDAQRGITEETGAIAARLKELGRPVMVALNKIDTVTRETLLPLASGIEQSGLNAEIFMISALGGDGTDDLLAALLARMPRGPWLYPEDQLTDITERMLAAEITREQLFLQLREELPYSAAVETENWQQMDDGSVRVEQVIYLLRSSHKRIVLGKGGQRIGAIGAAARAELGEILGCKVHLFLFVKVRERWLEDPERYRDIGLEYDV
jgi:GTP-binding protein Era